MVRAAFKVDGANFHQPRHWFRVVHTWRAARTVAQMETANNRPLTKPRFPQGSEVWTSGCPKPGAAERSGLTRLEASRTRLRPRHPPWPWGFASPPNWLQAFS